MMRGKKRSASSSDADPSMNDSTFQNKRGLVTSPSDSQRVEPLQQKMTILPTLDARRAESARQHVRALNSQFVSWVQTQQRNHPDELWEDGTRDYLSHASNILDKFSDVVTWLKANATKVENSLPSESVQANSEAVSEIQCNEGKSDNENTAHGVENASVSLTSPWSSNLSTKSELGAVKVDFTGTSSGNQFGAFSKSGTTFKLPHVFSNSQSGAVSSSQASALPSSSQASSLPLFSSNKSSALFSNSHSSTLFSSSQPSALFSNNQPSALFSSSHSSPLFSGSTPSASFSGGQASSLFSNSQSPVFMAGVKPVVTFGTQGSNLTSQNAKDDVDGDDEPPQPSSPSVKKSEEKGIAVVHEVKCKLYVKSTDPVDKDAWKDKGTGQLSIKCREGVDKGTKESKPTVLIRNDVGKLLLNALIYPGIKMNKQKNAIVAIFHSSDDTDTDGVVARTFLIRTKSEDERNKLASAIQEYAPAS